jgi:GTP-binding protein Era
MTKKSPLIPLFQRGESIKNPEEPKKKAEEEERKPIPVIEGPAGALKTKKKASPRNAPKAPRAPKPRKAPAMPELPKTRAGYVALVGRPNSGKSTLLNTILGQKIAITSDKPQTTRISILGIHTTEKGQIIFIDNPGIHKPLHKLNKRMMNFVHSAVETADLVCLLIDAREKFGHGDEFALDSLRGLKKPVFLLINKVDIVSKGNILPIIERYKDLLPFKEIVPISALKGTNVDVLVRLIFENLPAAEKLYGDEDVSDQSERFLLAEVVREKVLAHVEKELPWATAVYIDQIERRKDGVTESDRTDEERAGASAQERNIGGATYIKASIFVERPNQLKIIIGRQGGLIKQIGIEARREIEQILETKVFLNLQVKVREGWRDAADVLDLIEGQMKSGT